MLSDLRREHLVSHCVSVKISYTIRPVDRSRAVTDVNRERESFLRNVDRVLVAGNVGQTTDLLHGEMSTII